MTDVCRAPLSFGQHQLWLLDQMRPGGTSYNLPLCWRLSGALDVPALEQALGALVSRHETWRTRFEPGPDQPRQVVDPWRPVHLEVVEADATAGWRAVLVREAQQPFDLAHEWPWRGLLLRLGPEEHVLCLVVHHIACDGWSLGIVKRDLGELYAAAAAGREPELPELPVRYVEHARRQRRDPDEGADVEYWTTALTGLRAAEVTLDRARTADWDTTGASTTLRVDADHAARLVGVAREERASAHMAYLAALLITLSRWTGQPDVAVATPVAGRATPDLADVVGHFVNPVVIRLEVSPESTVRQVLRQVRQRCLEAYSHPAAPYEQVVAGLRPDRDEADPLFQVMLSVAGAEAGRLELAGLEVDEVDPPDVGPMFDLAVELRPAADGTLHGFLPYAPALFDRGTVEQVAATYAQVVAAAAADPDGLVVALPLLGPEAHHLLASRQGRRVERPRTTVHDLVADQARRTPDSVAVATTEDTLTYTELDRQANGLAARLRQLGVVRGSRVGVALPRGTAMVVGLLGVLKAGGAYVPLDPQQPRRRTVSALTEAGITVVLAEAGSGPAFPGAHVVTPAHDEVAADPPAGTLGPDDLLYVLYTSGSTGTPKGVLVPHRGMVNRALWGAEQLADDDRVLHKTALTFDAAGWEIWAPLVRGVPLLLAAPGAGADPTALAAAVSDLRATVLQIVPTMLRLLVAEPSFIGCTTLRTIFSGGEPLTAALGESVTAALPVRLVNLYGPTECTIDVTSWPWTTGAQPAIGRPLPNVGVQVRDPAGRLCPIGAPGELYVAGAGVAHGYLARPALTADRFVPDPERAGGRLYRTGDRVRWREDGVLEFLGRIDDQVKIGGVRIELGEIEAQVDAFPGVTGAAASAPVDEHGDHYLAVHVEPDRIDLDALRRHCADRLPRSMVPAVLSPVAVLPRTSSGKIDRRRLPALERPAPGPDAPGGEPQTPTERLVASAVAAALTLPRVGRRDNFFRLGGHSLPALRVVTTLRRELGIDLPARLLFEAPTVEEVAARVDAARGASVPETPRAAEPTQGARVELVASSAQRRMWFMEQLRPGTADYLLGLAFRLRGRLELEALQAALDALAARHEPLRTRFERRGTRLVQVVDPPGPVPVEDRGAGSVEAGTVLVREIVARPFALDVDHPFRAALVRIGVDDAVLVLGVHHVAFDARSEAILTAELSALYRHAPLEPPTHRFADHAVWEEQWLESPAAAQQRDFWAGELAGLVPLILPGTGSGTPGAPGGLLVFGVSAVDARGLAGRARLAGATPYEAMLTCFVLTLRRETGLDDIALGTTTATRDRAAVDDLIGPFLNSVVLRFRLEGATTFEEALPLVRQTARTALQHQQVPFDDLVRHLRPPRERGRNPYFDVLFELEPHHPDALELAGLEVTRLEVELPAPKLDLTLHLDELQSGSYRASIEYDGARLGTAYVQHLAEVFCDVVHEATERGPVERTRGARTRSSR